MAPSAPIHELAKRLYCDVDGYCYHSSWDNWGRWVALAVIIVVFVIILFSLSILKNRRRRRAGLNPWYGDTNNWGFGRSKYYYTYAHHQPPYSNGPAPPYEGPMPTQNTGTTFSPNDGYYGQGGNQQAGFELQQPQHAYRPQRGGDGVYDPPVRPPPAKN